MITNSTGKHVCLMETIDNMDCDNDLSLLTIEELRSIFNEVDKDGSGSISNKELYDFLTTNNYKLSDAVIKEVYKRADKNEDGTLDFQEFVNMVYDPRNKNLFRTCLNKYINFVLPPLPKKRGRTLEYTCYPPPIAMIAISVLEIILFSIDAAEGKEFATGPVAQSLLYHPHKKEEIWRFITYMFVHVGYLHLIMNLLIQICLGVILEMGHGWWRVLLVYLAGVLTGSLGTSVFDPNSKLGGASGGVYSLITAHVASIILNWNKMRYPVPLLMIFATFMIGDISHTILVADPHIGHSTHFCGALAGFLVGFMVLRNISVTQAEQILQIFALIIYIGLMSGTIAWNFLSWC